MHQDDERMTVWQFVILALSVYVLIALFVDTVWALPAEISKLLGIIDDMVCVVFIADFFYQVGTAPNRSAYLRWGWLDLVSSIPNLEFLRWGRFARIVRILRIMRAMRSARRLVHFLFKRRAQGAFASVALISFVMIIFSSIAVLNVETVPEANIKNAEDALWWSFVTITTVGYGDRFPVTLEGRCVAAILMTVGVGLFGTFTAYVASMFIAQQEEKIENEGHKILQQICSVNLRLEQLENKLNGQK